MTITVDLPEELEAQLTAGAQARGLSLSAYVREFLQQSTHAAPLEPSRLSATEIDRLFDEAADLVPPDAPVISDAAMSRESLYSREDEW